MDHTKELEQLESKLLAYTNIQKPSASEIREIEAVLDRVQELNASIATEDAEAAIKSLRSPVGSPVGNGGFRAKDQRSHDEKLHRIGEWLQATAAASCDDPSRTFGRFQAGRSYQDVINAETRAPTGMSESTPSGGGFLIGETLADEVLTKVQETSVLWPLCRNFRLSERSNSIKIPYIDESARTDGERAGGIRGYWEGEGQDLTASQVGLGAIEMSLKKITCLAYATSEVVSDAGILAEVIIDAFAAELSFQRDNTVLRGTGAGQPLGVLNADCLVSVSGSSSANTIVAADITGVWARLHPSCRKNSVWVVNGDCYPELMDLNTATDGTGSTLWLPANQVQGAPYTTIFGKRVVESEHASTVGDVGDVILGDFSKFVTIEKPFQSASSIHVRFTNDEIVYRMIGRLDGQCAWSSALTPAQGTNTTSSFVTIATRT